MRCRECETHLQSYLDRTLSGPLLAAVRRHLSRCEGCQQTLEERRVIPHEPALQVGDWTPPPGFVAATVKAAQADGTLFATEDPRRAGRSRRLVFGGLLALVAALLIVPGTRRELARTYLLVPAAASGAMSDAMLGDRPTWRSAGSLSAPTLAQYAVVTTETALADTYRFQRVQLGPGLEALLTSRVDPAAAQDNAALHYLRAVHRLQAEPAGPFLEQAAACLESGNSSPAFTLYRGERLRAAALGGQTLAGLPPAMTARLLAQGRDLSNWHQPLEKAWPICIRLATEQLDSGDRELGARLLRALATFGARLRDEGESREEIVIGAQMNLAAEALGQRRLGWPADESQRQMRRSAAAAAAGRQSEAALTSVQARGWITRQLMLVGCAAAMLVGGLLLLLLGLVHRGLYGFRRAPEPLRLGAGLSLNLLAVWAVPAVALVVLGVRQIVAGGYQTGSVLMATAVVVSIVAVTAYLALLGGRAARSLGLPRLGLAAWIDQLIDCPTFRLSPRWDYVRRGWLALDWRLAAVCLALALACSLAAVGRYHTAGPARDDFDPIALVRAPFDAAMSEAR